MPAAKRRFGSVRRLPSDRYQARYRTPDGRRHTAPTTFATKRDADRFLNQVELDLNSGKWIDPGKAKRLFGDWAVSYVDSLSHIKPKTRVGYQSLLDNTIVPKLGPIPLSALQPGIIRNWVAQLTAEGRSASRIRQSYNLVHSICSAAHEDGAITANPCRGIKLPKSAPPKLTYLTVEQVATLRAEFPPPFDLMIDVLAYGGVRFGEIAALRVRHCNNPARLEISEAVADINGQMMFGSTKTHQTRWVTLPTSVADELTEHISTDLNNKQDAFVFTKTPGIPLRHTNFMRDTWKKAAARAGMPKVTPHVLRHTCATLLIDAGASIKDVQMQLGHADATVTLNIYGSVIDGRSTDLAQRLDRLKSGESK